LRRGPTEPDDVITRAEEGVDEDGSESEPTVPLLSQFAGHPLPGLPVFGGQRGLAPATLATTRGFLDFHDLYPSSGQNQTQIMARAVQ